MVLCDISGNRIGSIQRNNGVLMEYGVYKGAHYWLARIIRKDIGDGQTIVKPKLLIGEGDGLKGATLAAENDYTMVLNAGLFSESSGQVQCAGTTIREGVVVSDRRWAGVDQNTEYSRAEVLCMDETGMMFTYDYSIPAQEMADIGVYNAVQGFGTIIKDGALADLDALKTALGQFAHVVDNPGARNIIGQFGNGDYLIFSTGEIGNHDGGMSMQDIGELLLTKGATFAYNLDGGNSTCLFYGKTDLAYFGSARKIPSVFVFE
jgi:exopolysaccharide biosynthesis protein